MSDIRFIATDSKSLIIDGIRKEGKSYSFDPSDESGKYYELAGDYTDSYFLVNMEEETSKVVTKKQVEKYSPKADYILEFKGGRTYVYTSSDKKSLAFSVLGNYYNWSNNKNYVFLH